MTTATDDPKVIAEGYALATADIDPDPAQPRLEVDDELAASIEQHGVLKEIEVRPHPDKVDRWMIVDGERRWKGAKKAGLRTIPAKVTFDVEGVNLADRMVRQIVHNTGKPLTPIEEAIAFKKIIDAKRADIFDTTLGATLKPGEKPKVVIKGDPKYGPVALARELGLPKSTVTDRLAATEIPAFWQKFIVRGPLQASHVPSLHKIREMPEKYQLRVLTRLQDQYYWPTPNGQPLPGSKQPNYARHAKSVNERIRVDAFEGMLAEAVRPFIRPLSDVGAQYKGPTAKLKDGRGFYSKERVMAIDPSQWEPILRKKRQEKAAKTRAAGGAEAKAAKQADRYRAEQARHDEQRRREDEKRRRWWKARPQIFAALAEKIGTMSLAQLQAAVIDTLGVQKKSKSVGRLVAKGTTAEQFIRHLAMCAIADDADYEYGFAEKAAKLGKRFGVRVASIVKEDAEEPEEKQPDPATTDPGEAGDGFLVADEMEDEEGADAD